MVTLLKGSFGWLSISPELHFLMIHAQDFLERWSSIGLYGEQGLEAWHGRYNQGVVKCAAATELERAAALMRSMALAREAGADVLGRYAPKRKPAAAGARIAKKIGDKRRRENKPPMPVCGAKAVNAAKKRKKWAAGVSKEAATTVSAPLARTSGPMHDWKKNEASFAATKVPPCVRQKHERKKGQHAKTEPELCPIPSRTQDTARHFCIQNRSGGLGAPCNATRSFLHAGQSNSSALRPNTLIDCASEHARHLDDHTQAPSSLWRLPMLRLAQVKHINTQRGETNRSTVRLHQHRNTYAHLPQAFAAWHDARARKLTPLHTCVSITLCTKTHARCWASCTAGATFSEALPMYIWVKSGR